MKYPITKECENCKKDFVVPYKSWNYKRTCSKECGYRIRKHPPNTGQFKKGDNVGKNNPMWKGEKVGYTALHDWVRLHNGRPDKCEIRNGDVEVNFKCTGKSKNYYWANIDGEYSRSLDDFMSLCASCHRTYDFNYLGT